MKAEQTKIAIDYMINAVCNLNCIFCYGPIFNKNVEMNFNLKLKLMDGLIRNGIRIMVIGGGEPFLSDDLTEFCKISNKKGLKIGIQTNGFFSEQFKDVLHLIDWIGLPLDGISTQAQVAMRTSPNHFEKLKESLSEINKYNNVSIKIGTVVSKYNVFELEQMASFLSDININVWKLYQIRKRGKGKEIYKSCHVSDELISKQIQMIKNKYKSLNIYYSSDSTNGDSFIIIDPDSSTYVINDFIKKDFGKLITEEQQFDDNKWKRIIDYTNLHVMTNNIKESFPGWIN